LVKWINPRRNFPRSFADLRGSRAGDEAAQPRVRGWSVDVRAVGLRGACSEHHPHTVARRASRGARSPVPSRPPWSSRPSSPGTPTRSASAPTKIATSRTSAPSSGCPTPSPPRAGSTISALATRTGPGLRPPTAIARPVAYDRRGFRGRGERRPHRCGHRSRQRACRYRSATRRGYATRCIPGSVRYCERRSVAAAQPDYGCSAFGTAAAGWHGPRRRVRYLGRRRRYGVGNGQRAPRARCAEAVAKATVESGRHAAGATTSVTTKLIGAAASAVLASIASTVMHALFSVVYVHRSTAYFPQPR
jgi:hypothetical protein